MVLSFGHSTLSKQAAIALWSAHGVETLLDVRSHPMSKWLQWHGEELREWVPETGLVYLHEPRLGGWSSRHLDLASAFPMVDISAYSRGKFPKQRIAAPVPGPGWTNQGLLDYSWFMSLPEFLRGADALIEQARHRRVAIMCAEVLWWKCHRSMIADYLWTRGVDTLHMQPRSTLHSKVLGNRLERYDPAIRAVWRAHATIV